jgi:hypothetical protein
MTTTAVYNLVMDAVKYGLVTAACGYDHDHPRLGEDKAKETGPVSGRLAYLSRRAASFVSISGDMSLMLMASAPFGWWCARSE